MRWVKHLALMFMSVFVLTGCVNNYTSQVLFCDIAEPILISGNDTLTDETAREILKHNLVGRRLCRW
ncbi:hypothetical protein GJ36_05000 [Pasteurella multocida]|nr:hypothetical protein UQU_0203010 [Pasteurella multocida subsp. multocida VTCCBAA264]KEZ11439.1 hypothetical protein GJ36_05000 [Pasteurella multocida]KLT47499.1 hypothetical protein PVACC_05415 [Pasteurella multocida subsp. multocida]KEZ11675.1 hypothetical protein GJ37_04620 [Pasteurella multocida]KLT50245.1 hypothetical protein PMTX1_05235 [Pasteurella multocida subsp. multocida]